MDVSIIVPAYNETQRLDYTLQCIHTVMRDVSLSYEILVVDNGSTDSTTARALDYADAFRLDRRETIGYARNAGVKLANGKVLAFIDADVWLTPRWASRLQSQFSEIVNNANVITGGQYLVSVQPSWVERYWFKALEERRPKYINAGNLILSMALFKRLGGFDPDLVTNEDVELCRRAASQGVNIEPDPGFAAHHDGYPRSLLNFFKRELWCGQGDFSSVSAFFSSRTAMFAVIVTSVLIASLTCLAMGLWHQSAALLLFVVAASMMASKYKYGFHSARRFFVNSALMIVHLVARAFAFVNFQKRA